MAFKRKKFSRRPWKKSRGSARRTRTRGNSFQRKVKKVLLKTAETKYYDIGIENEQLYHNCGSFELLFPAYIIAVDAWFNPWLEILKGISRFNRIGDKIVARGIKINLMLFNKHDRPNTKYRVIVATLPKSVGATVTSSRFDPFQIANSGAMGNNMIKPPDSDKGVRFIYDKIHTITGMQVAFTSAGGGGAREMTKMVKLWIKSKSMITYDTTDGANLVNKPLAVYVIPYEQYSTLETDNIASCAGFMRMYYKDP